MLVLSYDTMYISYDMVYVSANSLNKLDLHHFYSPFF